MFWPLQILKSQLFTSIPYPTSSFAGQTVIITGSNTGLGLEAARHIVRLGAVKVILAVRSIHKGEAAAGEILASTQAEASTVEVWQLDLSSHKSIIAFGERVASLDRLDAFIQNAGILTHSFSLVEGDESQVAINVIAGALVGLLALPKLRETSQRFGVRTRLAFNGSDLHYIAKFKEADGNGSIMEILRNKEATDMGDRYNVSKLLLLYTVREFAARSALTPASNVVINCFTPGACKTDIFRDEASWFMTLLNKLAFSILARTAEVGSRTLVYAVKPELDASNHGSFLMDCKVFPNGSNVDSVKGQENQRRWIEELLPALEEISPGCTDALRY